MLTNTTEAEFRERYTLFRDRLAQLGWAEPRSLRIDYRWTDNKPDLREARARELVGLAPDVIFAPGTAGLGSALQATRSIPVVFGLVPDPVGSGFVNSLARPGGNATGFTTFDYGIGAKWLELLKEIAPNVTRAGVIRDPTVAAGLGMWGAIQSASPATGIEVSPINMTDADEIERAIAAFAQAPNGSLIVTGSALTVRHRDLIISLAARRKLPAIYYDPYDVAVGGLVAYGVDNVDQFRRAAGYVDRILKGEKPADMPAQQPTKYELVINRKTAAALGLVIPDKLLSTADKLIE